MKRKIISKELWFSFIAIAKYFPNVFTDSKVNGMDFYLPEKQAQLRGRILQIMSDSQRVWGTMDAAQMMHHLALSLGGALGYYKLYDESYWLSRTLFKWILIDLFNKQPRALRLPMNFVISGDQEYVLDAQKTILLEILEKASQTKNENEWGRHPLFGRLTRSQWGKLALMHFDYHLRQFSS
jgi:hypothetical protein